MKTPYFVLIPSVCVMFGCSDAKTSESSDTVSTSTAGVSSLGGGGRASDPPGAGGQVSSSTNGGSSAAGNSMNAGGAGSGGSASQPPGVSCYKVTARATMANDEYVVPTTPDLYQCFDYASPWGDKKVQIVSAKPIVDNAQVIHHWILYSTANAVTDGHVGACSHPGATFITGWAPGGQPMEMPSDVGLRVDGAGFTLETHYNNKVGEGQTDASGVEICVTENLRPKEAAVHWLGTVSLNKLEATGTCVPANKEPVTILASSPHMHLQGRHMKTVINRMGGATETLIDKPFDFNTQVSYPTPATINPGDTLTTTCTYATPTPFGEGTNSEMCFNFVTAYPAGALSSAFGFAKNDCTGF